LIFNIIGRGKENYQRASQNRAHLGR